MLPSKVGGRPHPGLTITTYSIDPATLKRRGRRTRRLAADPTPPVTNAWPPCRCPRHGGRG